MEIVIQFWEFVVSGCAVWQALQFGKLALFENCKFMVCRVVMIHRFFSCVLVSWPVCLIAGLGVFDNRVFLSWPFQAWRYMFLPYEFFRLG